ncbi:MAG: glutathione S-transferase N-terminal domain-containing protein [Rhodocyclaceae bacterium]|nr:glutathione S-transferase N-terminal domain-containing protein [Rhodocyclaceae bacterium]
MKLIGTYPSPFVRKVRIVLAEKKIDCEFLIDSPWVAGNGIAQYNPLGKIPVLVLDDDSAIYDSRVIVEHLDNGTPNNKMIPPSGRERMLVKRWEALGDGLCEAAIALHLERKRKDGERSEGWIKRQRNRIENTLSVANAEIGEQPWCNGSGFSLADIALGTALGYCDLRLPDFDWRTDYPNLARLFEKLSQRQSFIDTVPHD